MILLGRQVTESFPSAIATIARATREPMEERRPLRRQPDDHHFWSQALVLEEIAPDDKNRNEVLGARVILYMAAKVPAARLN
jgi:hypothetical protein